MRLKGCIGLPQSGLPPVQSSPVQGLSQHLASMQHRRRLPCTSEFWDVALLAEQNGKQNVVLPLNLVGSGCDPVALASHCLLRCGRSSFPSADSTAFWRQFPFIGRLQHFQETPAFPLSLPFLYTVLLSQSVRPHPATSCSYTLSLRSLFIANQAPTAKKRSAFAHANRHAFS